MSPDPMEEVILEVLLGLQVHHLFRAFELALIEGPFQCHDKGGNLLIIAMADLIEVLPEKVKGGHHAKINR